MAEASVVVVVDCAMVVVEVAVVVVVVLVVAWCRLSVTMITKAANSPTEMRPRLTR